MIHINQCRKSIGNIEHAMINRTLRRIEINGKSLKSIKIRYKKKSTTNIILNGERVNAFSLRSGTKAEMSVLITTILHSDKCSAQFNKAGKENDRHTYQ